MDKFIRRLPAQGHVLDVGCGAGEPIAGYLLECGLDVTGLDASANMLEISRSRFPDASWINMDMRELKLDVSFDGIISWDGFFHLTQQEQRQVLFLFAEHLNPEGSLLLTIGHEAGEVTGMVEGEEVYHSSLEPDEYESILNSLGFNNIEIKLEDESCGFHSVLLATRG
ncbi:MAG: class I SAM-dependent methyltransferase [Gammaproteobacteria bacterium]|nr:class I SAM-dependent methyltransferase [Gammaproteobacteria bacterium]